MKIDPIKYYKHADSDDDDYASSEEIKAAYDRLFPDTLDSIIKKISEECVDNLEDDWEEASYSDFDDSDLTDLSTFYHGTVKPYAQRKHIEDFVNSSKPEFIPLESAKDFVKMSTTQQYQCLIQSGIRFCLIQKLPHVYCAKYGIFRFIQADINGSFVVHKELPSELQQIIEPDSLIHSFRHLFASLLVNQGVDIVTVSGALGHSSVSTTSNIYCHMLQDAQAKVSDAVGNALDFRKKKEP